MSCTNRPGLVKAINTVPGISDHHIIVVDSCIKAQVTKKPKRIIHQWSKADWDKIRQESEIFKGQFMSTCEDRDVEQNYEALSAHIQEVMDKHVPKKMSSSRRNLPW